MERPPKSIVVWGAGGHGRVVGDLALVAGYQLSGYIDGDATKLGQIVESVGVKVLYLEEEFISYIETHGRYPDEVDSCALGMGDNRARQRCLEILKDLDLPHLVHPSAAVSPTAYLGRATVICAQAVVNAGAWIGDGVIVNSGSVIEHDCIVCSTTHISPGAVLCGRVEVGEGSWIGAGATLIPGVTVGRHATVGAGSTVLRNVNSGKIVVGSPAAEKHPHGHSA